MIGEGIFSCLIYMLRLASEKMVNLTGKARSFIKVCEFSLW